MNDIWIIFGLVGVAFVICFPFAILLTIVEIIWRKKHPFEQKRMFDYDSSGRVWSEIFDAIKRRKVD